MMTVPDSTLFRALYERMKQVYNGGWATHSIDMVDTYFKENKVEGTLILPYGALYPFSLARWNKASSSLMEEPRDAFNCSK